MLRSPIYRDKLTGFLQEVSPQDNLHVSYPDNEPTGFPNRTDSIISFDESSRTFSISPTQTSFNVYLASLPKTFGVTQSIQISNTTGLHFIYFSSDTFALEEKTTFSEDIITKHAFVTVIYWRADLQKQIYFADERHGITMDGATHLHLHDSIGTQYISGLSVTNISIGDGDNDSHAEFGITGGVIRDEDIKITIPGQNVPGNFPVMYRTANNIWNRSTPDNFPLLLSGDNGYFGNLPAYNYFDGTNWQIAETPQNSYMLVHILACNDIFYPVQALLGNTYSTVGRAREAAQTEFGLLSGLPFTEYVPIATLIYQANNTYANIPKARIVKTEDNKDYIDWRKKTFSTMSGSGSGSSFAINTFIKALNGFDIVVNYSEHNLSDIVSYKVINNVGKEVSTVLDIIDTSIYVSSNIDLNNHTLIVKGTL